MQPQTLKREFERHQNQGEWTGQRGWILLIHTALLIKTQMRIVLFFVGDIDLRGILLHYEATYQLEKLRDDSHAVLFLSGDHNMAETTQVDKHDLAKPQTLQQYLRLFLSGFTMGAADIIPGVSGGTMAFILGIYETLIDSIKSVNVDMLRMVLKLDIKGILNDTPVRFMIALGLGIITAVLLLANLLHTWIEEHPTFIFAFFAGLILASILAIAFKVRWTVPSLVAFVIATVFAFGLVGLRAETNYVENLLVAVEEGRDIPLHRGALIDQLQTVGFANATERVDALIAAVEAHEEAKVIEDELEEALYVPSSPVVLFFSGMVAICAMLLPGISGAFILLILGQYATVLGAVKTLDMMPILAVGLGALVGIITFSRVISWLLKHYRDVTVAALVGFMTGSLRLIYTEAANGVSTVNPGSNTLAAEQIVLVAALILIGFMGVSLLDHLQGQDNPVISLGRRSRTAGAD